MMKLYAVKEMNEWWTQWSQEISQLSLKPKVSLYSLDPSPISILGQVNQGNILSPYLSKINFDIIIPSMQLYADLLIKHLYAFLISKNVLCLIDLIVPNLITLIRVADEYKLWRS